MGDIFVDAQELKNLRLQVGEIAAAIDRLIAGHSAPPTVYCQRNQPWSNDKLGTSQSTLGLEGCLVTGSASMLTDAGKKLTPGELNAFLKANGGFVNDAGGPTNAKRMVWATLNKLGVVKFVNRVECWWVAAPMTDIKKFLDAGDF